MINFKMFKILSSVTKTSVFTVYMTLIVNK